MKQNSSRKLTVPHLVKRFLALYGTRRFITALKMPSLIPILSQISPVHGLPTDAFKTASHIILPSAPWCSKMSLSFRFPYAPHPRMCHMPCPSDPIDLIIHSLNLLITLAKSNKFLGLLCERFTYLFFFERT